MHSIAHLSRFFGEQADEAFSDRKRFNQTIKGLKCIFVDVFRPTPIELKSKRCPDAIERVSLAAGRAGGN